MPALNIPNPLKALDLTSVDVRKAVAPAAKVARDAAYVAVGVGVIATQRVAARRFDAQQRIGELRNRINEVAPRVRTEAQETAQRVLDEAGDKVRSILERRKNVSTSDIA